MIYNILAPLASEVGVLNVFRYITFRSVWALLTALIISILFGPAMIRWLQRIKCGQYIQEDGPKHQAKQGTPTMGGIMIIISVVVSTLLWGDLTNIYVWLTMLVFVGFGAVGFADDYTKVIRRQNEGLSAKSKFFWQCLVAGAALYLLIQQPAYSTELSVPFFKNFNPDLGWFYLPFAMIVMVGASNAVNLTDGLDGLAIGPMIVAMACFAIFIYVSGHAQMAEYLAIQNIQGIGEVTVFCGAMVGAGLGFLWFNAHPAQVFMGDVGSLSLGGALGFVAVLAKQELLLAIVGGVFVFETLSVILQVGYFKLTGGKRIFMMAPLHHHFELKGIPESKIIVRFWILSILMALMALSTLKLR
ncbi:phospho-N-acetylmuramoyl-pentapeptide transferase [Pseudodesulfovibrio profundus]|uniref:Phospho-N-acetylmuramoyl-pentapeptide-transferase n=1 Tax=Pseudodesulfovibrio profundus TaxID=57320 RepID=A0A2C8FAZ5_9BACT|nr:phospho-N-acetylmuramoyl-pentapeptide-transferase [Pseudodesulfovibrio profundus]MBC15787.1 phospho-N-acetylmuramoyl-pentapeptide-transferase [Desulfovibrio sp.]SOB59606.1 phospho-N-acetylmuramoyl-pentapeptide transferase [Pseudodesulfovibrio profundus]|tara:strand:+ start:7962 stop:9038 length:1077 start_codon:yes stop_codon:yes gene_type:complete